MLPLYRISANPETRFTKSGEEPQKGELMTTFGHSQEA